MTILLTQSNIDLNVGEPIEPIEPIELIARDFLSEQELLYIEFVMALDAKLLPDSSSRHKTSPIFLKKALKG